MLRILLLSLLLCCVAPAGDADFNGRWVIEPDGGGPGRVAWLELKGAGSGAISGTAVGLQSGGQVDPIAGAKISEGGLSFHVERVSGQGAFGPGERSKKKSPTAMGRSAAAPVSKQFWV